MNRLIQIIILCLFTSSLHAEVNTQWVSNIVVPGEETSVIFLFPNGQRAEPNALPAMKGASARFTQGGFIPFDESPTRSAYCLVLAIITDTPGQKILPSLTFNMEDGSVQESPPSPYTVLPFTDIMWSWTSEPGKPKISYGILWHVKNKKPYVDEPTDVTLKVYTPSEVQNFQSPNVKTEGLAANRFETISLDQNNRPSGTAFIKGENWNVISFQSTFTPLRYGKVKASGEITLYLLNTEDSHPLGQIVRNIITEQATLPALTLEAQQLPTPAPAGFKNAVGKFTIETQTDARDLSSNEPVSVRITIRGTGNIAQLQCPNLTNDKIWKLYPPNKVKGQDNNVVVYQQLIHPTSEVQEIPSFTLTFFNPQLKQYQTVLSAPIPLPWKTAPSYFLTNMVAASTPPPAGDVPIEQMTDILAKPPTNILGGYFFIQPIWYFFAYIPVCALLGWIGFSVARKYREKHSVTRERFSALKEAGKPSDRIEFLRSLGAFIESNIPPYDRNEEIENILQTRDEVAFRPDTEANKINASERNRTLRSIRSVLGKLSTLALLACLLVSGTSHAETTILSKDELHAKIEHADNSYDAGQFSESAKTYTQIIEQLEKAPASTPEEEKPQRVLAYYNFCLGNAEYRANQPGLAALAYQRALLNAPGFYEASKNLAFIQRKEGAIMPQLNAQDQWLVLVHYHHLYPLMIVSSAILLIGLLTAISIRRKRVLGILVSVLGSLLFAASLLVYLFYPQVAESTPATDLYIVTQKSQARHAADLESPAIISLPPSTPLKLLAARGSWCYVETFNGTRGWVNKKEITCVDPDAKP